MRFKVWLETRQVIIPVHVAKQNHNYDCGAAALRAVCEYFKAGPEDQAEFIKACDTGKEKGTHPEDIVKAARSFGLNAKQLPNMTIELLLKILKTKIPVICAVQAWGKKSEYHKLKDGHYVVAIGFDDTNIYFEDPSMHASRGYVPYQEFMQRWHDIEWGAKEPIHHLGIAIWKNQGEVDAEPVKDFKKIP
jgi:predicted double-glycine peptidase